MVQNPFNGIESTLDTFEAVDENVLARIHSMELKDQYASERGRLIELLLRIHSMELKGIP